jgi:cell division initiation protein
MTITPQDIQSKQFHVRMRGFDMDEVDKFLEQVAEEFLILSLENKQLLEKVETMEKELANYRNKEQTFQSAILSAHRISDEMQSRSRQEAEEMVMAARKSAEELEAESRQVAAELVERSRQEADETRVGAKAEAQQILSSSMQEQRNLTSNINHLIKIKGRIMADLRQMLNHYLEHIEEAVPAGLDGLEPLPQAEEIAPAPDFAGASGQEETSFSATSEEIDDSDMEDLFEKIDLSDHPGEVTSDNLEQLATLDITDIEPLDLADEDNPAPSSPAPDLTSEEKMLFSLEDPLDELEPSVSINEDDKTG